VGQRIGASISRCFLRVKRLRCDWSEERIPARMRAGSVKTQNSKLKTQNFELMSAVSAVSAVSAHRPYLNSFSMRKLPESLC
jgi:hypothetical protein